MSAPRVGEFAAHSIGGALTLPLGLVGLLLGTTLVALGGGMVQASGAKAALITVGILVGIGAFLAMCGPNTVAPGEALQRQQAGAVVAARRQIVDGAVGMVEAAIARITVGAPPTPFRQ